MHVCNYERLTSCVSVNEAQNLVLENLVDWLSIAKYVLQKTLMDGRLYRSKILGK